MDRYAGALFRELAPMVVEDRSGQVRSAANKRKVLLACQQAIERIEDGTADLARPTSPCSPRCGATSPCRTWSGWMP